MSCNCYLCTRARNRPLVRPQKKRDIAVQLKFISISLDRWKKRADSFGRTTSALYPRVVSITRGIISHRRGTRRIPLYLSGFIVEQGNRPRVTADRNKKSRRAMRQDNATGWTQPFPAEPDSLPHSQTRATSSSHCIPRASYASPFPPLIYEGATCDFRKLLLPFLPLLEGSAQDENMGI